MKKAVKLLLKLILLTLLPPTAYGQEFVKEIALAKSQKAIVRDVSGEKWLVYDWYLNSIDMENAFLLVSENGATAPMLQLPSSIYMVNDFEIFDDIVYFCGRNKNGKAILGRFSLQGFPNTEVCIWTIPEMYSFNKLDVGMMNQVLHVFMTGEGALGGYNVVDAAPLTSTYWNFCISNVQLDWCFDDVVFTTSDVVYSAHSLQGNYSVVIEFPFPSLYSYILPGSFQSAELHDVKNNILLKASSPGKYAFMANASWGIVFGEGQGLVNQWKKQLGSIIHPDYCMGVDVAYNPLSSRMDAVVTGVTGVTSCMIHPYNPIAIPVPPIFTGHGILDDDICSLDGIGSMNGYFIAAGSRANMSYLGLYRYKYNVWNNCFEQTESFFGDEIKWEPKMEIELPCGQFPYEAECGECETDLVNVYNKCQ